MAQVTIYIRNGNRRTIVRSMDADEDTDIQSMATLALADINRPDLRDKVWVSDGRHEYKAFFTEGD